MVREIGRTERNPWIKDVDPDEKMSDRELSHREQAEQLAEIHEYLREREARLPVVATTVTTGGQRLDWVEIEAQTGDGKIASPPAEDEPDLVRKIEWDDERRRFEPVAFELTWQHTARGPEGTVPILHRDLTDIHPTGTLQDLLSKYRPSKRLQRLAIAGHVELELPKDNSKHKYAYSSQSVTAYGGEGYINAWDPYTEMSDEFSLGQVALARGSGKSQQTVEAGHQEYHDLYGDWVPHLFVFYTTNGYSKSGDKIGGYNRDVNGWVQYSRTIFPGARSSPLSSNGGTQYAMHVKYQLYHSNWWLRINGHWIGYYPASLFKSSGLRDHADKIDWYGEVAEPKGRRTTATSMGSGRFPNAGWQHAAYMSHLYYQSSTHGSLSRYNAATWASDPSCYGVEGHFDNTGSWAAYFWWGGPGRNRLCP